MATLPRDFTEALAAAGLAEFFAECTASHQREYLKWIDEAKRPVTRQTRIAKAIQMISAKRTEETARQQPRQRARPGMRL